MHCKVCNSLLTSPIFDSCPACGFPIQIGLRERIETYLEVILTSSVWGALHSSAKDSLIQAEGAYHTTWLTEESSYSLETIRRLYARVVAFQFEADIIAPFGDSFSTELGGRALDEDLANKRVYWLAKYLRKGLKGEAYTLSIQQLYLLLTYLGGKNIRRASFIVDALHDFVLSCGHFRNPSRLWSRTKHIGECKFRVWVGELAFFDEKGPKCYSTPPSPLDSLQQLHAYRRLLYTLEGDNGLPLLLNVTQGVSVDTQPSTKELLALSEGRIESDYDRYSIVLEKNRAKLYAGMPFPIVAARHAVETSDSHHSRFVSALRCAEMIAAYCAVIATAERFHLVAEPPFVDRENVRSFFTNRHASFGSWIALLQRSVEVLLTTDTPILVSELVEFARSPAIGILKNLKHLRDQEDAHAMPYPENVFAMKLAEILPLIDRLYQAVSFLRKYAMVVVKRTENLPLTNRYDFLILQGTATDFHRETKDCSLHLRLSQDCLYVVSPHYDSAVSLAPLLIYEPCETCNQEELFFLDIIDQDNRRATYRSPLTNHRKTTGRYLWLFSPTDHA